MAARVRTGPRTSVATVAVVLSLALAFGFLLAGGSDDGLTGVHEAEALLWDGVEAPLVDAGLVLEVTETCHLPRDHEDEPAHLVVEAVVEAPPAVVASVLRDQGAVVVDDREPMVVQQHAGSPSTGWNGQLAAGPGGSSVLGLTFNGVEPDLATFHAWLEVCTAP